MKEEVSYIKTQWFRLLIALFCLVMACVYAFKPAPEVLTVEALDEVMSNMLTASLQFSGFLIWSFISFIDYNQDRIELLEKKAEKYDALCENVSALNEANRIDREHMKLLEQRINQIKYDKENPR
jgi:type VI protein secretion system component VasK